MKYRYVSFVVAFAAVLFPARVLAVLGVGDIVFDPTSYSQLLQSYAQGQSQLDALGNIVGLNSQQADSLKSINMSIGVSRVSASPRDLTSGQVAALSQGLGVEAGGSVSNLYQRSGPFAGALDVFMGTSLDSFRSQNAAPWTAFSSWASRTAIGSLGTAVGLDTPEIEFTQAVARLAPAERQANQTQISRGLAALSADRFAKAGESRRLSIQAEANLSEQASERAAAAKNVNENGAAANELAASRARLQAIAAQHQNEANETLVIQGDSTNATLKELNDRRAREELEQRVAAQEDGNDH